MHRFGTFRYRSFSYRYLGASVTSFRDSTVGQGQRLAQFLLACFCFSIAVLLNIMERTRAVLVVVMFVSSVHKAVQQRERGALERESERE